jgi:uncharacterized protein YecE (DUF72 family)
MEFGKISDLTSVDFALPPDRPATADTLAGLPPRNGPPALYFGCTGWAVREWVGTWYPTGTKATEYLSWYGRQFDTIELNTTHYRIPAPEQVAQWRNAVPEGFRFCPKIPQRISHSGDLGVSSGQILQFAESALCFEEKLGPSFLQLPPTFGPERLSALERFLRTFPVTQVPLAVEFRHPDWFAARAGETGFDLLREKGVSTVITDVAGRRDVLHQNLTTGSVLIRFVGNELHPTDIRRADDWNTRLADWFARGLREAFVFVHQPDNRMAPAMAAQWIPRAARTTGTALTVPQRFSSQTLFDGF